MVSWSIIWADGRALGQALDDQPWCLALFTHTHQRPPADTRANLSGRVRPVPFYCWVGWGKPWEMEGLVESLQTNLSCECLWRACSVFSLFLGIVPQTIQDVESWPHDVSTTRICTWLAMCCSPVDVTFLPRYLPIFSQRILAICVFTADYRLRITHQKMWNWGGVCR